ncbi:MAG: response regulator [Planctomycetaceae bacterium]|nr:response regulator [Planctomycetaceae bacterium]
MKSNAESVLDEIRSTIASFESMRGGARDGQSRPAAAVRAVEPITASAATASENHAATAAPAPQAGRTERPIRTPFSLASASAARSQSAAKSTAVTVPATDQLELAQEAIDEILSDSIALPSAHPPTAPSPRSRTKSPAPSESSENILNQVFRRRSVDKTAKVMIVDDEPLNIMTFRQHLKMEGYNNFVTTEKATQALTLIRREKPDIVLLDIRMPEVSGIDILRVIGLDPALQHIPVLILTAATDPRIRRKALELGASDFLSKAIDPNELLPRVRNAIVLKQHYDMVSNEAARLEQQVERRTQQLEATRQQLILSLARAAEHRDDDTGNHVIRVGRYTAIIAHELGYPTSKLSMLEQAAQLHDVGKIGIPDSILFKPGKLDWDQYELMKRHCAIGKQIIEPISEKDWEVLKTHTRRGESLLHVRSSPLLMLAARIAQTHHEKFDGSGYPLGLAGNDIPLEGRIVAVADVFDALSSARPYKKAFSRQKCFEILEEGRGKHFDPQILDAFFEQAERIIETQLLLMDEEEKFVGPDYIEELAEESPEDE